MKRRFRLYLAVLLCFAIMVTSIPMGIAQADQKEKKPFPSPPVKDSKIEIQEWRTAKSRHFYKDNGTFEVQISGESKFYQDPSSKKWKDIDNTIIPSNKSGFTYKNKANKYQLQFAANAGTEFSLNNSSIHFIPAGTNVSTGEALANNFTYKNIYSNTDIKYFALPDSVKEEIILNKADTPNTFSYDVQLDNLTYEQKEDGSIEFYFKDSKRFAFIIPKPFMYDSSNEPQISNQVTQSIHKDGDKLILDIVADTGWIKAPGRKFPVIIDPSIETDKGFFNDTFVSSTNPTSNYANDTILLSGTSTTYGKTETYIRFPLPGIPDGAQVQSADVKLYHYTTKSNSSNFDVREITNAWSAGSVTWNNKPQVNTSSTAATFTIGAIPTAQWINFPLNAGLVQDWYTGKKANNGIAILANPDTAERGAFISSNHTDTTKRPIMTITYNIDPEGTNGFWFYNSDGVMPYKGNLNLSFTDLFTSGKGLGTGITRAYNSRQTTAEGVFGKGWASNLDMKVWDLIGSVVFLDSSGVRHTFDRLPDGTYSPPAGNTLSLTRDDTNKIFTVKTTENVVFTFDMNTGKLLDIVDANNLKITYTIDQTTGDLIITDPSGRKTTVHFGPNGKVNYATDPKGRKVEYIYNANSMLQDVIISYASTNESKKHSFLYNAQNLLATYTDPNGNQESYSYDTPYNRIQTVTNTIQGQTATNTYFYDTSVSPRKVTVTGPEGYQVIYYGNDNGNIVKIDQKLNATEIATSTEDWSTTNWLQSMKTPKGDVTSVDYGDNGKPIKVTTPDGKENNLNYDYSNNLVSVKDANNQVQDTKYKGQNPVDISDSTGSTTMQDFDSNGNMVSQRRPFSMAENYIYNSGFERKDSGSKPLGWSATRTLDASDAFEVDANQKTGGYSSLHLKSGSTPGLYAKMNWNVPVASGKSYNLSSSIKNGATSTSEFKLSWYNSTGTLISEDTRLSYSRNTGSTAADWYSKSTSVTAPAAAASVTIQVGIIGQGEAWFDNFIFEGGMGRSSSNLLTNASFEFDLDKTSRADEWYPAPSNATGISIDYLEKKFGVASESLEGSNSAKAAYQDIFMPGNKGTKFNLSGWGKHLNVPTSVGTWGIRLVLSNTDGTTETFTLPFDPSNTNWQQASRVYTASKDFDEVTVKLVFDSMPTTAKAWFDEVSLSVLDLNSSTISTYNHAENSSFEVDYDNTQWPDGWYKSSGDGTYKSEWVDLNTSNGNVYTGSHAIKITDPSSNNTVYRQYDMIPFDGTKSFTATGYIKTFDVSSSAVVTIFAYDSAGVYKGEIASTPISGTTDWTRVNATISPSNAPAGTQKIAIGVQMRAGTGTAYFDNIHLQEGDYSTKIIYDALGNYIVNIVDALGQSESLERDDNTGNVKSITDFKGNKTSFEYSMLDWLTKLIFPYQGAIGLTPVNKTFTYSYDNNGNLLGIIDPNNKAWASFQYNEMDALKRFEETVTWNGQTNVHPWVFDYDASGSLNKTTLPDGKYTKATYDNAGRMTGLTYGSGTTDTQNFSFAYDLNGNLKNFGEGTALYSATYDNMDRLLNVTEPNASYASDYEYDAEGNRTKFKVKYNTTIWTYNYEFDDAGKPKKFWDSTTGRESYFLYDEAGMPRKVYNSNKSATFYEYDGAGQLKQLRIENDGLSVVKYRYDYDSNGNIKKIWNDIDATWVEYTYDTQDQLLLETYSNGDSIEYQYDELGNRKLMIKNGVNTTYTYNSEKNRLVSAGSSNYAYDANGNVTSDGVYSYIWGNDNRLQEVKQGTTSVASFKYDAFGRRYEMTAGGVTKTFHYDGDQISWVSDSSGKVYRFAYDHEGTPIFMSYQNKQYWYHYDAHGNVIRMTDEFGNSVAEYKYDAWGNITSTWSDGSEIADLNPFRYAGYVYDKETKKYYLNARYYDPEIGRFLSEDSFKGDAGDPLSLNYYAYVKNNPVMNIDLDGHRGFLSRLWKKIKKTSSMTYSQLKRFCTWFGCRTIADGFINGYAPEIGWIGTMGLSWKYARFLKAIRSCQCFTAGTKVLTDEGEKNIEDIEVGDKVLSKDETTGEVAYKEVTATFNHETDEIYNIHVGNQTIESTFNHPFYVEGKGWTFVKDLKVGDLLVQSDGNTLKIDSIELLHKHVTVYNMTVDEFHTYFVSDLGIWVHNSSCVTNLLGKMSEFTGSTREKLLSAVRNGDLRSIVNELYRPGGKVGDGGTAAILTQEFYNGTSTHLLKAQQRLKQLNDLAKSGKLGLNDLDIVDALTNDLEKAVGLFK